MGTDTIVSISTILILIRILKSEELEFEISISVVLSMMARERLKFLDMIFRKWQMYSIQAGRKSSAVSCVIYFCCLVLWKFLGGREECSETAWKSIF